MSNITFFKISAHTVAQKPMYNTQDFINARALFWFGLVLVVLGSELRTSHLLGRTSNT
jgi:formate/nitrite transporter FocA (FNT family)